MILQCKTVILLTVIFSISIFAVPTNTNQASDVLTNPQIPQIDESQCYICHEEDGSFPNGGRCNIDSIIEECQHRPRCRNDRDWRCGHVFCKNCITTWKTTWTNTQRQNYELNRPFHMRFHCPRCMKQKGCSINVQPHAATWMQRLANLAGNFHTLRVVILTVLSILIIRDILLIWIHIRTTDIGFFDSLIFAFFANFYGR